MNQEKEQTIYQPSYLAGKTVRLKNGVVGKVYRVVVTFTESSDGSKMCEETDLLLKVDATKSFFGSSTSRYAKATIDEVVGIFEEKNEKPKLYAFKNGNGVILHFGNLGEGYRDQGRRYQNLEDFKERDYDRRHLQGHQRVLENLEGLLIERAEQFDIELGAK